MNAEMIIGLVIISIVAAIMVIIGISQFNKKENPVGFYNVIAPPKKEEISDVIQWNKKHGFIWIVEGIVYVVLPIMFCGAPVPPEASKDKVYVFFDQTAYSVALLFAEYVAPALYVALVAELLVDQPRKV